MKLNKDKPFITRINDEQGIRFIQDDVAYTNAGVPMGKMVKGKLVPFKGADAPKEVKPDEVGNNTAEAEAEAEAVDLDAMDLPALKEYAKANNVTFAGNIGADKLREKILAAE